MVDILLRNAPVGADDTLVAILATQEVLNHILAQRITHIVARRVLIVGDGVVWHNGRYLCCASLESECTLGEWHQMLLEVVAWVDCILTDAEVGITTRFARSTTRPMLSHSVNTLGTPRTFDAAIALRCLETIGIGAYALGNESRVFAITHIEASPTRLCREVALWRECCGDTQGTILLRCDLCKTLHVCRVESCRYTEC